MPYGEKALWLPRDNDFEILGNVVGHHGDKGVGGSRGSYKQAETVYWRGVTGHTHSPVVHHHHMVAGTLSRLDLEYTDGTPKNWMHSNVAIFENGMKQQLPIIKGKWFI